MPTYDYVCTECGHEFEEMLLISKREEPTQQPCSECGKETVNMKVAVPYFAYDNISTSKSQKKPPSWMTDKLKTIKKEQPKSTMSVPF